MQPPDLDPLTIAITIAAALVGPKLAPYVGAYTLILFGWFGGVLVGVYRRDSASRMGTAIFVTVSFVLTVGVTVPAAQWLSPMAGAASTALLFPVSFLIPAVGDTWNKIAAWAWNQLTQRLSRLWGTTNER